jgi:hypothetical protein
MVKLWVFPSVNADWPSKGAKRLLRNRRFMAELTAATGRTRFKGKGKYFMLGKGYAFVASLTLYSADVTARSNPVELECARLAREAGYTHVVTAIFEPVE